MILASTLTTNLAILVLAGFIGFVVISKVPNTLHTPLMSGTNAIHGIVLLGGLLLFGLAGLDAFSKALLVIAVAFGTINVVGGFLVTDRMLEMFKSKPKPPKAAEGEGGAGEWARRFAATGAGEGIVSLPPTTLATSVLQSEDFIYVLYIIAFALFIQGLRGLAGPTTAVRGNRIAAVGMAIAVVATLLNPGEGNWGLIALGIALGVAVGVPAARQVKMTAMPQMVALFNGVGGGAVALISWVEFRHAGSTYGSHTVHIGAELPDGLVLQTGASIQVGGVPTYVAIFSVFAAIVGSISFWGSNIAFGKLQEIIPGRPISFGSAQQAVNLVLLVLALAAGVDLIAGAHSELLFIGMLIVAALLGNAVVLPIGGADMPVVISLLNAFTGLSAAATGMALNNPALIVAGMIVGASGTILTNLMATAMNRSIPAIVAGGFGGGGAVEGAEGAGEHAGTVKSTSAADAAIQLAYAEPRGGRPGLWHGRRPSPARGTRADQGARGRARSRSATRSTPSRGACRDT